MTKYRAVSTSHGRSVLRLLTIIAVASADAGLTPEQTDDLRQAAVKYMTEECYVITLQVTE